MDLAGEQACLGQGGLGDSPEAGKLRVGRLEKLRELVNDPWVLSHLEGPREWNIQSSGPVVIDSSLIYPQYWSKLCWSVSQTS